MASKRPTRTHHHRNADVRCDRCGTITIVYKYHYDEPCVHCGELCYHPDYEHYTVDERLALIAQSLRLGG